VNNEERLKRRVNEGAVSKILMCIADPPNRRKEPIPGDLVGSFDFWFDGGAAKYVTGWTEWEFSDGSRAKVDVVPGLAVRIQFANGCGVEVLQVGLEFDKDFLKPFFGPVK
jgi:hypothetical protein